MSFILDALRKSEHERQRSAVPGLSHVPIATPRREIPVWTFVVIGVLAAAVLVLGGAWWQAQRSAAPATTAPVTAIPPVATQPAAAPPVASPPAAVPAATTSTAATAPAALPPPAVTAASPAPAPGGVADSAPVTPFAEPPASVERTVDSLATAAALPKEPRVNSPTLPSAAALQAQGIDVPALRLELHGYSVTPAERFVFINGRKYREGERLGEGPEVVAIEPNGVVLSQQGHRFQLAPE